MVSMPENIHMVLALNPPDILCQVAAVHGLAELAKRTLIIFNCRSLNECVCELGERCGFEEYSQTAEYEFFEHIS